MKILAGELKHPSVQALLAEHVAEMRGASPPESSHALDIDAFHDGTIQLFTAWEAEQLLGCGALKRLKHQEAEIKAMRTTEAARGRGIGQAILEHLIVEAQAAGIQRLNLETGSQAFFAPARRLYTRHGFTECGPFADYTEDPNSVFMTCDLAEPVSGTEKIPTR